MPPTKTEIHPSATLPSLPYAPALHSLILTSYKRKDIQAFPPSWHRLAPDVTQGLSDLGHELGPNGSLILLLSGSGEPIACAGLEPHRGLNWISHVPKHGDSANGTTSASTQKPHAASDTTGWEVCCFCVSPEHRGQGLARTLIDVLCEQAKLRGGNELYANYSVVETGNFWTRMGFADVEGGESVLKKGFTHTQGMEGLREDLHFKVGVRQV
ncbi:hypothetical protein LTR95_014552 [Oleoguttula sp. CCFEE 5521]